MPTPDDTTTKAMEVYRYLASQPFPEHPPDLEFIFKLVGLRVGSAKSRQVYERLILRLSIEREYREKRGEPASHNGDQAGASS